MSQEGLHPLGYAIRILPRAERDIDGHVSRMADLAGPDIARSWHRGLFDVVATLAQNPRIHPWMREGHHFRREVRQTLYQRTPSGPAWRVLFTLREGGDDGPTVFLLHVRHGAQRPITRLEACVIEAADETGL